LPKEVIQFNELRETEFKNDASPDMVELLAKRYVV